MEACNLFLLVSSCIKMADSEPGPERTEFDGGGLLKCCASRGAPHGVAILKQERVLLTL